MHELQMLTVAMIEVFTHANASSAMNFSHEVSQILVSIVAAISKLPFFLAYKSDFSLQISLAVIHYKPNLKLSCL